MVAMNAGPFESDLMNLFMPDQIKLSYESKPYLCMSLL